MAGGARLILSLRDDHLLLGVWRAMDHPRCYVTGGYIRDRLLQLTSADLDISVPGSVDEVARLAHLLAASFGVRPLLLGKPGTQVWRIITHDLKVELWPLADLSLQQDIMRRDYTINALVWRLPEGQLIDCVGGLDDLDRRRVRCIARANLVDDPVRLLRGPRLIAQLPGFSLEQTTWSWIRELAPHLAEAPRQRCGDELLKLLGSPDAATGIGVLSEVELLAPLAPPAATVVWRPHYREAVAQLTGSSRHPVTQAVRSSGLGARLAVVLHAWGLPAQRDTAAYSWPAHTRSTAHRCVALLDQVRAGATQPFTARRRLIHRLGTDFPDALAFAAAMTAAQRLPPAPWRRWWRQWQRVGHWLVAPPRLLGAAEVCALTGLQPGPGLGAVLHRLTKAQIEGTIRSSAGARRLLARISHDVA